MRGNVYSCPITTPLLPKRCPKQVRIPNKYDRIKNHPDYHKYKLKDEYKYSKKNKVCNNSDNIEYKTSFW